MKTYKVIYVIGNQRKVAFYQTACADFARMAAYKELGNGIIIEQVVEA